jgi:hypothetical protein
MVQRWKSFGYKDTCLQKSIELYEKFPEHLRAVNEVPSWLGKPEFHASHKSNLLRKNHEHYSQFNWKVDDTLPYVWPSKKESKYEHTETDIGY